MNIWAATLYSGEPSNCWDIFSLCPALLHALIFAVLSGNCFHSVFCSDNSRAEETYAVLTGKRLFLSLGKKITAAEEEYLPLRGVCPLGARRAMYHSGLWLDPRLKSSTGFIVLPIVVRSHPLPLHTEGAFVAVSPVRLFPIWICPAWCSSGCFLDEWQSCQCLHHPVPISDLSCVICRCAASSEQEWLSPYSAPNNAYCYPLLPWVLLKNSRSNLGNSGASEPRIKVVF